MNRQIVIPLFVTIALIIAFWFIARTLTSVQAFIPGAIGAFIFYLVTAYKHTPKPDRILSLYLLALGIQFLHFTEEYLTNFTEAVPALFSQAPYPMDYWIVFNMVAYFVFILGGIILFMRIKELMIIPLFFLLVGVLLNSFAHIMLSIYTNGYFSGLYTAIAYAFVGPLLIKRL